MPGGYTSRRVDDTDQLSAVIRDMVADVMGVDSHDVQPVDERIDIDALSTLFSGPDGEDVPHEKYVCFELDGCTVFVSDDGRVVACASDIVSPASSPLGFIDTADDFSSSLATIVTVSYLQGIEVRGSWPIRSVADVPDWEVEITTVEKPFDGN